MMEVLTKSEKWRFNFFLTYIGLLKIVELIAYVMLLSSFSNYLAKKDYDLHCIISGVLYLICIFLNLVSMYIGVAYNCTPSFFAAYEAAVFTIVFLGNLVTYSSYIFGTEENRNISSIQSYFFDIKDDRGCFSRIHLLLHILCLGCCIIKNEFEPGHMSKPVHNKTIKNVEFVKEDEQAKDFRRLENKIEKVMEMLEKLSSKLEKDEDRDNVSKEAEDYTPNTRKKIKVSPDLYLLPSSLSLSYDSMHKPSPRVDNVSNINVDVKNRIKYFDTSISESSDICDKSDIEPKTKNIRETSTPEQSYNEDLFDCKKSVHEAYTDSKYSFKNTETSLLSKDTDRPTPLQMINIANVSLMKEFSDLGISSDERGYYFPTEADDYELNLPQKNL